MNAQKTVKTLIFMLALTMLMPAVQLIGTPDAAAFGILSSSRKSGKREHKQSEKKSDKSKRSNATSQAVRTPSNSRTTSSNTRTSTRTDTRSRTTYRSAPTTTTQRRTVYRTQPHATTTRSRTTYRTQPRTTTTTRRRVYTTTPHTTHHSTRGRVVHRRHYVAPAPRRTVTRTEVHHHHVAPAPRTVTRTEVHHHHTGSPVVVRRRATTQRYYYGSGDTSGGSTVTGNYNRSNRSFGADQGGGDATEAYITAGAGVSGFAASQISNDALPGMGFNVGLGAKSGWLAGELGFNMSGYRLDPAQTQSDMALVGVSADLKLQPSFAFLEPYALVGVGGQYFNDSVVNQSATGGALRLGAGLDVRIDNVALSAQYLYTQHGLFGAEGSTYQDNLLTAQTETIGVGLKLYF